MNDSVGRVDPQKDRRRTLFTAGLGLGVCMITSCTATIHERVGGTRHVSPTARSAEPIAVSQNHLERIQDIPAPDPQACAASVLAAQQQGNHPERLSLQSPPAAFVQPRDRAAMQVYLNVIEPGRVYQTADPRSGAAVLEIIDDAATRVIPRLGTVVLAARTAPGAPCTFVTTDGGSFDETRLACATVVAASDGIARVTYRADDGTVNDTAILIGSPARVDTRTVSVHVHHPDSIMPAPAGDTNRP